MRMLVFVVLSTAALVAAHSGAKYTSKYDGIDLDEILGNDRLLGTYYNCLMDLGKCPPEGHELKSHMKEALEENCAKCTDVQKNGVRKMIGYLINHKKEWWNSLCDKYDPDRKYSTKYESELRSVA